MKILIMLLISLSLISCSTHDREIVSRKSIGKIISAEEISVNWAESRRTRVVTDEALLSVNGVFSVFIGDTADVTTDANGRKYLCMGEWVKCRRIYQ